MGRERLDLICFALSALVLSSDYLIHTVDTDYRGSATFMIKNEIERRESRERERGVQRGQVEHTYLGDGWVAGERGGVGGVSIRAGGQGPWWLDARKSCGGGLGLCGCGRRGPWVHLV